MTPYDYLDLLHSKKLKLYFSRRNAVEKIILSAAIGQRSWKKKSKKWQSLRLILG
jgi:hypothetical protein